LRANPAALHNAPMLRRIKFLPDFPGETAFLAVYFQSLS
jgi:hypothetical protein